MLLSTRKGTTFNLHEWIFTGFRTQLEELIVPDNYIEDLSRLRKTDDGEKITLKKIDFTRNKIQTLSYDDFMDLPEGTEVIIKENPINADATALQKFKDGLDFSGVQAKFIWE
ncbi:MAG: leucine-rich repeat domain-containing protein [Candidatus Peribacteria bacterium]|jgi:hypothetical protein|nr:leucine-rich repeat domain-containing protein [Candidatus Peribacteria bacterium]